MDNFILAILIFLLALANLYVQCLDKQRPKEKTMTFTKEEAKQITEMKKPNKLMYSGGGAGGNPVGTIIMKTEDK